MGVLQTGNLENDRKFFLTLKDGFGILGNLIMTVAAIFSNTNRSILFAVIIGIISSSVVLKLKIKVPNYKRNITTAQNNFSDTNKLFEKVLVSSQG